MRRVLHLHALTPLLLVLGCLTERPSAEAGGGVARSAASTALVDSFAHVPDSAWIDVQGPMLIAFFPLTSSDELARDADRAELLDHLSFNLGMASDSLEARGFRYTMRSGDTLWLRAATRKWRFIRVTDSALVGFYLTSPQGLHTVRYGSGAEFSLLEIADAFLRSARAP